jgi:hypothetical protein
MDSDASKQIYHLDDLKVWVERKLRLTTDPDMNIPWNNFRKCRDG